MGCIWPEEQNVHVLHSPSSVVTWADCGQSVKFLLDETKPCLGGKRMAKATHPSSNNLAGP